MHGGISGCCKYFRMKLYTYHLSYGISFYSFRYTVGRPSVILNPGANFRIA